MSIEYKVKQYVLDMRKIFFRMGRLDLFVFVHQRPPNRFASQQQDSNVSIEMQIEIGVKRALVPGSSEQSQDVYTTVIGRHSRLTIHRTPKWRRSLLLGSFRIAECYPLFI